MKKFIFFLGLLLCIIGITSIVYADSFAQRLSGKILLQVENNGEAWYINPANNQRYFLGRPENAFELMRKLGVGITNDNLSQIPIASDSPALPIKLTEEKKEKENKSWQTIKTFSGNDSKNTETFTINSDKFKTVYAYTGSSNFIVSADNPNDILNSCSIANFIGNKSDETICYNTGTFYLDIMSSGDWIIEIQEYK